MTETNAKILKLISENKTLNEISNGLELSNKQIMNRIRNIENNGYDFNRNYYYNGDIRYSLITNFNNSDEHIIITRQNDKKFKAMFISDLHFGTTKESIEAINTVYDYCIKENIHIIINCGDVVHGMLSPKDILNIYDYEEQFEHLIKNYPYDKSIINFIALGNHDLDPLTQIGFNMHKQLNKKRHDLVSLGYETNKITIKNQEIYIRHSQEQPILGINPQPIIFQGHSHFAKISNRVGDFRITIPSLSYNLLKTNDIVKDLYPMPSAMVIEFDFINGYFHKADIYQLLVSDKVYTINYITSDVLCNRKKWNPENAPEIKNEEDYQDSKIKQKVLKKDFGRKSQIEKFNMRYNIK